MDWMQLDNNKGQVADSCGHLVFHPQGEVPGADSCYNELFMSLLIRKRRLPCADSEDPSVNTIQ